MLQYLFLCLGRLLTDLAYGARGAKARRMLKGDKPPASAAIWMLLLIFLIIAIFLSFVLPFKLENLTALIGLPAIYVIYFICTRKKIPQLVKDACAAVGITEEDFDDWDEELKKVVKDEPAPTIPAPGQWQCSCGRIHANYVSSCPCGNNKHSQIAK